jgi:quercetin dioxygenase-like cupin family protein
MSAPYAFKRGEGPTYSFGPNWIVKAGERDAGRRLAFVEYTTKRGEEPGPHTHTTEDEIFYVLSGEVSFRCGDDASAKTFDMEEGGFVFLPRGIEHSYTIRSEGDVRMLIVLSPADELASGGWGGLIGDLEAEAEGKAGR